MVSGQRYDLIGGGLKRSNPDCAENKEIAFFDERILGSGSFVEMLTQCATADAQNKSRLTMTELLQRVSTMTGITVDRMQRPGKERSTARAKAVFCCLAVREYGYTGTEAGKAVGIGSAGASIAVRRGVELFESDPELADKLSGIG